MVVCLLWMLCVVRGLCDGLITRPEESYRLWCVVVCDLETSWMRRSWPTGGLLREKKNTLCRSQWPRGLWRRSAAALPAEIVGSNPTGGMDVCCECRVLSGRGLCDELITRPKESCRLWCVVLCDLKTSRMMRPWPALGRSTIKKTIANKYNSNWQIITLLETCGRSVIISIVNCQLIVNFLVIVQNNKICTVQVLKLKKIY